MNDPFAMEYSIPEPVLAGSLSPDAKQFVTFSMPFRAQGGGIHMDLALQVFRSNKRILMKVNS